jgi:hypothetical protein
LGTKHGFDAKEEKPILFDVEQDLSERIDRAAEQPETVQQLTEKLRVLRAKLESEGTHWDK